MVPLLAMVLGLACAQLDRQWPFRLMPILPSGFLSARPLFPNLCTMMIEGMGTDTPFQVITQVDDEQEHAFTGEFASSNCTPPDLPNGNDLQTMEQRYWSMLRYPHME